MRLVIQRVKKASCTIDNQVYSNIDAGLLVFLGFTQGDNNSLFPYFYKKIANMRIFTDNFDKLNLSIQDIHGKILVISQFTLYAWPYNGNRPSFTKALAYEEAKALYEEFCQGLNQIVETKTGVFGADMQIELLNDGPVTILLDSNGLKEANYGK